MSKSREKLENALCNSSDRERERGRSVNINFGEITVNRTVSTCEDSPDFYNPRVSVCIGRRLLLRVFLSKFFFYSSAKAVFVIQPKRFSSRPDTNSCAQEKTLNP